MAYNISYTTTYEKEAYRKSLMKLLRAALLRVLSAYP